MVSRFADRFPDPSIEVGAASTLRRPVQPWCRTCGMSTCCGRHRGQGRLSDPPTPGSGRTVCLLGQREGGWVIHFPAVVCTSSPNTAKRVEPCADATVGPAAYRHRPHLSL